MSKPKRKLNEHAKIDWKPWPRTDTEPTFLSLETMHGITVNCRWAFCLMQNTKAELIRVHTEIFDPGTVDGLMANFRETQLWLIRTEHMVAAAHERLLASAEAADAKGLKFKGVVDLNGPVPRGKAESQLGGRVS
jgi:hypothetical protein